jgi:D-alanyl-D-alanine carboxypeptidase
MRPRLACLLALALGLGLAPGLARPALAQSAPGAPGAPGRSGAPSAARAALGPRLDSLVRAAVATGRAASASVAVVRGRDTLLLAAHGKADLEQGVAATPATVYLIGSTTKQFTAAAILQQVERGTIRLDDEITKYLPAYPMQGRRVTVRQLLNHTSGIADYTSLGAPFDGLSASDVPQDSLVGLFARAPFTFEPGTQWSYSNSGYHLLGVILERVTGEPYAQYLQRHVYPAAGLRETYYCSTHDVIPHRARGYELEDGRLVNTGFLAMSIPYSAGGLCSTPRDLVRWERALADGKVVSPASFRLMNTPEGAALRPMPQDTTVRYGFAEFLTPIHGHASRGHGGAINGYGSALLDFPDDSLTVSVLVNTAGPVATALARQLAGVVFGVAPRPWLALRPRAAAAKDAPLGAAERARYVGRYRLAFPPSGPEGTRRSAYLTTLRVYEENGRLMATAPGWTPDRLMAQGGDVFLYAGDPTTSAAFTVRDGRATHVRVASEQGSLEGDRVAER